MQTLFRPVLLLMLLLEALSLHAQTPMGKFFRTAREFEVRPMKEAPSWARHPEKDLFCLAWITDQHFVHEESVRLNLISLHQLRDEIRPLAVMITGDNCGLEEALLPPRSIGSESLEIRRQKYLKKTLDEELQLPYFIIPGDNWPGGFNRVFGSDQYSFNLGGYHFIFFSADYQAPQEGCVSFKESSLQWLSRDLQANADRPCIYLSHEPVYPQVFADAPAINALFKKNSQVIGAICGHLHLDLEFRRGHWTQWIGPSIGRSHRPAFKLIHFQKEAIIMESYEWNPQHKKFLKASKWQRITVPAGLQKSIDSAPLTSARPRKYNALPPHARISKPELKEKTPQIAAARMAFIIEFGLGTFFRK